MAANTAEPMAAPLPMERVVSRHTSTCDARNSTKDRKVESSTASGATIRMTAAGTISQTSNAEPQLLATT